MSQRHHLLEHLRTEAGASPADNLLGPTLDLLPIKVVIVACDGQILHFNVAAASMLSDGDLIWSRNGILHCATAAATRALIATINQAARETYRGGLAVPLCRRDGRAAIVHARSLGLEMRCGSIAKSVALFICDLDLCLTPPLGAFVQLFGLTPAEMRVVHEIARGNNRKSAATALGLAVSTVKTHLDHIFQKTGTSDQIGLNRLIDRLSWPIQANGL